MRAIHVKNALCLVILILHNVYCDVIVRTNHGEVRGKRTNKALQFLGIPYAKPPVGDLRWRSPETPTPWSSIYNATELPLGCPQKYCTKYLPDSGCPDKTSEDCLYLNVWTPLESATSAKRYPVMVFLHGGAFKWGYPSASVYDGNNIVSHGDVILVTVAYRIGLLGFLYTGQRQEDCHGNYGIQDQRLALQWIRDNVKYFGGDPENVIS